MAEQYSVQAENLMKTAVEEYIDVLKDIKATDANLTVIQNIRVSISGKPRRLVDVAQDCIITIDDCFTTKSITIEELVEGGVVVESISERDTSNVLTSIVIGTLTTIVLLSFRSKEYLVLEYNSFSIYILIIKKFQGLILIMINRYQKILTF